MDDDNKPEVAGTVASIALLVFFGAHVFFLITWFWASSASTSNSASLLNWKMILTLLTAIIALALSATLWRNPSRVQAILALVTVASSLLRVGLPNQWTGYSFAIFALTAALSIPLVSAAVSLKR
jgi:hypothetical protein